MRKPTVEDRLHEALAQRRALESIVNQSPMVVFRFRAQPPHAVEYVSENISRFGYTPEDFVSGRCSWRTLTHPTDLPKLTTEQGLETTTTSQGRHTVYRVKTSWDEYRWVDDYTAPLYDAQGRCTHFQGIVLDVTEQYNAQQLLLRSERMAAVGLLATGVAHEFNNVHTSMMGFVELALETPGLPKPAREKLQRAMRIGRRAAGITQNLLGYTRTAHAAHRPHDIRQVIQDSVDSLQPELEKARVTVDVDVASAPPILLDRTLMSQLLRNLLINAIHALVGHDRPRISIRAALQDNRYTVCVIDNGIGIPEENLSKVFLPFFSTKGERAATGSPEEEVRGTGLGLYVCEAIARDHGGELTVESEPDHRTVFTFCLPLA